MFAIAAGGSDNSPGFTVALAGSGAPALTLQPLSRSAPRGTTVQFNAAAAGVEPLSYQWQFGDQNIPGATNVSLMLSNIQTSDLGDYRVVVTNKLGSATSATARLTLSYPGTLAKALNATNLVWTSRGTNALWFPQIGINHDGDAAARSGLIKDGEQSGVQTTVIGPGTLSFWWKVSSEEGFDFLSFYIGTYSSPRESISGDQDWRQVSWRISADAQTVWWTYSKDRSVSLGEDAGWLDQVSFTPDPPQLTTQPAGLTGLMGKDAVLSVVAVGAPPLSYQWLKNGTELADATDQALVLTNLSRRAAGTYTVRVNNPGGSILSSNAVLIVIVPQRLKGPVLLEGGTFILNSGDADGGPLLPEDLAALELQASTNLLDWITLPNALTLTNGYLKLQDAEAAKYPARFYRMVEHQ